MAKKKNYPDTINVQDHNENSKCLKIHGIDNSGFSSDSESGKSEIDDEYKKFKPHPINIDKKQIIIVHKLQDKKTPNKCNERMEIEPRGTKLAKAGNERFADLENSITVAGLPMKSSRKINSKWPQRPRNQKSYICRISGDLSTQIDNDLYKNPSREPYPFDNIYNHNRIPQPELLKSNIISDSLRNLPVSETTSNYPKIVNQSGGPSLYSDKKNLNLTNKIQNYPAVIEPSRSDRNILTDTQGVNRSVNNNSDTQSYMPPTDEEELLVNNDERHCSCCKVC